MFQFADVKKIKIPSIAYQQYFTAIASEEG